MTTTSNFMSTLATVASSVLMAASWILCRVLTSVLCFETALSENEVLEALGIVEFFTYRHNLTDLLFTYVSARPAEFGELPQSRSDRDNH
jgi:hypothetical protein